MEFDKEIQTEGNAHHLIASKDLLAVVNNKTNITFINPKNYQKVWTQQQLNIPVTHKYTKSNSSSSSGKIAVFYDNKSKESYIYLFNKTLKGFSKKLKLDWIEGVSEVSEFSDNDKYIGVGTTSGMVGIYSGKNGKLISKPPRESEYISAISFSKLQQLVAYSSFNKKLNIFDILKNRVITKFFHEDVVVVMGFLHGLNLLIFADKENRVVLFDVIAGKIVKDLGETIGWPVAIHVDKNDQYCLISDKMGYIHLIDLVDSEKEMEPIYQSSSVAVDFKILDNKMYVLFENGKFVFWDIEGDRDRLLKDVESNDITAIYKTLSNNPILRFGLADVLDAHDEKYAKRLDLALVEIGDGNIEQARAIMGKTISSPHHEDKFNQIVKHRRKIGEFYYAVRGADYSKAYALANSMSLLRTLSPYAKLEKRFETTFKKAQDLLVNKNDSVQAKYELTPFLKVDEKKSAIAALFRDPKKFALADENFKNKKFDQLALLVKNFSFLKLAPFYSRYEEIKTNAISKFLISMSECRYKDASKDCKFLKAHFPELLKNLVDDLEKLEIIESFENLIEHKKISIAMELASKHTFLLTSNSYQHLNNLVSTRFENAINHAYKGNFQEMHHLVKPFIKSQFSNDKAEDIYKVYYLEQINKNAEKLSRQHWVNATKNFVERFGLDERLEILYKKYDKEAFLKPYKKLEERRGVFFKQKLISSIFRG